MQRAHNLAENARQNQDYFIKENLKDIDSEIMTLHYHILFIDGRYAEAEDFYRKNERLISYRDRMATPYFAEYYKHPRLVLEYVEESRIPYIKCPIIKATKEDLEQILNAYIEVRQNFVKRLKTYLKRYGLTKIHSWSYLVD